MSLALLPEVYVYADGASRGNPGPAAIGIVICDAYEKVLAEHRETIGRATNNEAEYRALIRGLELASRYTRQEVKCHVDSQLVYSQLTGAFKIKEPRMAKLAAAVRQSAEEFAQVSFHQVPRGHRKIRRADLLANIALDERYGRR